MMLLPALLGGGPKGLEAFAAVESAFGDDENQPPGREDEQPRLVQVDAGDSRPADFRFPARRFRAEAVLGDRHRLIAEQPLATDRASERPRGQVRSEAV